MTSYDASQNYNHSSDGQQGSPPAHTVGTEFARQFYYVLTQQPSLAHRFYTDGSSLTHSTGGHGVTVHGQAAIDEKMRSLNLGGASAEVENVDAQYSLQGGVTVLVTGHLTVLGKERKAFVQSFFLATQERGYFVLNDTFRFLSEPVKGFSSELAASDVNGANQQYGAHQEANGYNSLGARPASSGGLSGQLHHTQVPSPPQPQVSAFQQANGHYHAPSATADLTSGLTSGHSSGDLAQVPSPPASQGLPPPPPKPSGPSVTQTPTPAQQTPTAPSLESSEQEPEPDQTSSQHQQQQQQPLTEQKGPSGDQPVPQPAVDQNRPPVKPQRRPSVPQEADKKGSHQQNNTAAAAAAAAAVPSAPRSYADSLRAKENAAAASGGNAQSSATRTTSRPQPPPQAPPAAPTGPQPPPSSSTAAAPALAPRPSGNRGQGRPAPSAAPSAVSDAAGKGESGGLRPAGSEGPPVRPPYNAPGGRGVQYNRDDDSSKKAVYVRNLPQDATSDELRELFTQFGTVKAGSGAITVKHNGNNNSFAYVDFVDVASAQACIEAKEVQLKDNILSITPKRANFGSGRGGRGYGRGDRGRGDGGFGRGRGGDRGGYQGRGSSGPVTGSGSGSGSFPEDVQLAGGDRGQAGRGGQSSGGQGVPRGRGGRDGGRGRGRGAGRSAPQGPEVTAPVAE